MVEEDVQYIELEIRRSYGTFGEIMVTINSVEESAVSPTGKTLLTCGLPDHVFIVGYAHFQVTASHSPQDNSWRQHQQKSGTSSVEGASSTWFLPAVHQLGIQYCLNGGEHLFLSRLWLLLVQQLPIS